MTGPETLSSLNPYIIIAALLLVLNLLAYLAMGMFIWIAKGAIGDLRQLEQEHDQLVRELPEKYVLDRQYQRDRRDYQADISKINKKLDRVLDKLDGKADKS